MDFNKLLDLLRKKDKSGLEILYVSYGEKLYNYAITRWSCTEDEGWELIYKTLEKILDRINHYEFESRKHFENFLYKVFKNNLRQLYRAKRRKGRGFTFISLSELELEDTSAQQSFNLEESFADYYNRESKGEFLIMIESALKELSEDDRDILLLRAQNFSYKEIAEMLNIAADQLKVKYHRAKKKLIKLMATKNR